MAKISLPLGIAIISISSFLLPSNTFAHSEHDKSRFVATNGVDKDRCDNVLRPCKTIAYAVSQANKGDKVLVASGEFTITSSEELFYLKSALVPVFGVTGELYITVWSAVLVGLLGAWFLYCLIARF